jgi:squalene synthase HpnC
MSAATVMDAELRRYGPHGDAACPSLAQAQAYCRQLARRHSENFTVASWMLPKHLRQHFASVYAFCRWADDLADETGDPQQSLGLLDWWESQLRACFAGEARHPVFVALAQTVREFEIPIEPFAALLAAFRQDQRQTRYETFDDLTAYCDRSASPVGQIVLYLGRCHNHETVLLSDWICTGLQLVNFCQDVARDWHERGRVYLPQTTLRSFGCDEAVIASGIANDAFRKVIELETFRAETFLNAGEPLVKMVSPELRVEVDLIRRGGLQVVRAIRRQRYDVLSRRPRVTKCTKFRLLAAAWWRSRILRV